MFLILIAETHGVTSDRRNSNLLIWGCQDTGVSIDDPWERFDLLVLFVMFNAQQNWIRTRWQICFTLEQSWLGPAKGAKYFQLASRFPTKVHLVACAIMLLWNTQIHLFLNALRLFWQRILGIDCSKNVSNHNLDKWIELGLLVYYNGDKVKRMKNIHSNLVIYSTSSTSFLLSQHH